MGIISISDLELATGTVIDDDDVGRTEWMIESISAYIEDYTGCTFTPVIDELLRCQADAYGMLTFQGLTNVSSVKNWESQEESTAWQWDGIAVIYGLCAYEVVDATVSYGPTEPPTSIVGICTELVASGLGLTVISSGGSIQKRRVGDIDTTYSVSSAEGQVVVSPSTLQFAVLDDYRNRSYTMRIGSLYLPPAG